VGKNLNAKVIHEEMFPVNDESVCRVKQFTLGDKLFVDNEDVQSGARK
jgi:hypothetical protein